MILPTRVSRRIIAAAAIFVAILILGSAVIAVGTSLYSTDQIRRSCLRLVIFSTVLDTPGNYCAWHECTDLLRHR